MKLFKILQKFRSIQKPQKHFYSNRKIVNGLLASTLLYQCYSAKKIFLDSDLIEKEVCSIDTLQNGQMKKFVVGPNEDDDIILLAKVDGQYYAVGNKCAHFELPLDKGVLFEDKIYCPFHFAAFSVKTGYNEFGPIFQGIPSYKVQVKNGKVFVTVPKSIKVNKVDLPTGNFSLMKDKNFVIIGGGPSGLSAAETLRQSGFGGKITIISKEKELPYDRTMLTKVVLKSDPSWVCIRSKEFLSKNRIDFQGEKSVTLLDPSKKIITLQDDSTVQYDKVLLASGVRKREWKFADDKDGIFGIRDFSDINKIKDYVKNNDIKSISVVGGNFISTEAAASLKDEFKEANINIITRGSVLYQNIFGDKIGQEIQKFVKDNGVNTINKAEVKEIKNQNGQKVLILNNGQQVNSDMVIYGIGEECNSEYVPNSFKDSQDKSVIVDQFLQSKENQDVFACGDLAKFPTQVGYRRVNHYHEAISQGTTAAWNMLGKNVKYVTAPFFWTRFFNKSFSFTGFAFNHEEIVFKKDIDEKGNFLALYCGRKQCFSAAGVGSSSEMIMINQALRLGIPIYKDQLKNENYFNDLKKEILKNKDQCACQKNKVLEN